MAKETDTPKSAQPSKVKSDTDVSNDLDARPQDIDKVKGGARKRLEDPCQGGEIVRP